MLSPQNRTGAVAKEDRLAAHRNLGKAFYENPATQLQAVEEFRKALELAPDSARERLNYALALLRAGRTAEAAAELKRVQQQDPKLPHTWFNLGIIHKKAGETAEAIRMFEQMARLVPEDAVTHYNLGVLYKLANRQEEALAQFHKAATLGPHLAAPHFQLFNAYRLAGKRAEAQRELGLFQQLKRAQEASGITEDMEWNAYAEIYDPIEPALSTAAASRTPLRFTPRKLPGAVHDASAGGLIFDFDADQAPDLLVYSAGGGLLFRRGTIPVAASAFSSGKSFAAGDANNDGFPDLCMLTNSAAVLLINRQGQFQAPKPLAEGAFVKAVWIDYDHDYDLDLALLGSKPVLLRNQGEGGFANRTADFPFLPGEPVDAVATRVIPDSKTADLIVSYRDSPAVLYRDRLAGKYEAVALPAIPPGARRLTAWDWNHDSAFDLAFEHGGKVHLLANARGSWKPLPPLAAATAGFAFADFDNRGVTELVVGDSVFPLSGPPRQAQGIRPQAAALAADFNGDGKLDLATAGSSGIYLHTNATAGANRWFRARLIGVKNLKLAAGAEIEVRAGRLYQKQRYEGYPLLFGLEGYSQIDAVRITWPNGLIQNEARQAVLRPVEYKEAQRLSGSCPMIFTWDGARFRFITDVLGVAPLGASSGEGEYFPTDHDEYVWIPSDALQPRAGNYELRITEELSEVTYLDQVQLIRVDHPAELEIYTNEKWKSPPYPEFRLFATKRRYDPIRAFDHRGVDVLKRVRSLDRVYVDGFRRTMLNTAERHALELEFPPEVPAQGAFLVLHGWVDWADGSAFRNQAQQLGAAITPPYLQVRDAAGRWRTVIEDMGIPSGKTKTIAVDLTGKFLADARALRIVTNMCVYWDQAYIGVHEAAAPVRLHPIPLATAELGFHGFSRAVIHPERRQPEMFFYEPAATISSWNPTPGLYTRYGDVTPLLDQADDIFVIMGSGDEVKLRFPAPHTSAPPGWKSDFLLFVDGWAKDSDANTAHSQTVEPLPFHGMSRYPYPATERYPEDEAHRQYRERYNLRPALRLLRPLTP